MRIDNPIIRLMIIGLLVGFVMVMLARNPIGWWIVLIATAGAILCAVTVYLVRFEEDTAKSLYGQSFLRPIINAACSVAGEQPPEGVREAAQRSKGGPSTPDAAGSEQSGRASYSVLRTPTDFEFAASTVKTEVLGHDQTIDALFDDLRRAVMVRMKRPDSGGSLLGVYLLVGPEGIGKRMLAITVARHFYPEGGLLILDGREFTEPKSACADIFGHAGADGRLLRAVRQHPLHTIIMECADSAHPEVLEQLALILQHGQCMDPKSGAPINLEHCLLFLLSTKLDRLLRPIAEDWSPEGGWRSRAAGLILAESTLPATMLDTVHLIAPMQPLNPEEKALVIAGLMARECERYRVQIDWIDPEILAEEVALVTDSHGFRGVHARVKGRLREPLARAVEISMPRLSLRYPRATSAPARV